VQYREELIMNFTVYFEGLERAIYRETNTEYYSVYCVGLGRAFREELVLNVLCLL